MSSLLLAGLMGCASPAERFSAEAARLGFQPGEVAGAGFTHVVYRKSGAAGNSLHVYLGGDGTPWFAGLPATDPTPRHPVALELMARDPGAALFLGRPCYHGMDHDGRCTSALWTRARYSETVVASLRAALARVIRLGGYRRVMLIGYSGGGTLAMLLAPRIAETVAVVTIAANLDIDAWTARHGYPRLSGSLNPAKRPFPSSRIRRLNFVGGKDTVVPAALLRVLADRIGPVRVVGSYDHVCCWVESWPELLAQAELATTGG